ncbi:hypothetical protein HMPREF1153_1448 [Selenomonas sp. CM52]|nr:hypothetical protein HMPREF1153_1448 [Selenomonas sp. CM52]
MRCGVREYTFEKTGCHTERKKLRMIARLFCAFEDFVRFLVVPLDSAGGDSYNINHTDFI